MLLTPWMHFGADLFTHATQGRTHAMALDFTGLWAVEGFWLIMLGGFGLFRMFTGAMRRAGAGTPVTEEPLPQAQAR